MKTNNISILKLLAVCVLLAIMGLTSSSAIITRCGNVYIDDAGASAVNMTTNFGGEVSGTYDAIVLSNTALDDQYYDTDGDTLTGNMNANTYNITNVDCIIFNSGGMICSD